MLDLWQLSSEAPHQTDEKKNSQRIETTQRMKSRQLLKRKSLLSK
jgi:hypothetical protein